MVRIPNNTNECKLFYGFNSGRRPFWSHKQFRSSKALYRIGLNLTKTRKTYFMSNFIQFRRILCMRSIVCVCVCVQHRQVIASENCSPHDLPRNEIFHPVPLVFGCGNSHTERMRAMERAAR